jgi:hypothetical protein
MLWYKAWLETRWRVLLLLAIIFFVLFEIHSHGGPQLRSAAPLYGLEYLWVWTPVLLAGSGIRPECPLRTVKGAQGSMYFTLSLPVGRLRLFAVRAGLGLLETAGVIAVLCCAAAAALPEVRAQITLADGLRYGLTMFACGLAIFGISTVLATFLDQQWQMIGSMLSVALAVWLFRLGGASAAAFDFFRALSDGSPLITHVLPWTAMCTAIGIGAISMLAAVKVENVRQY